MPAPFPCESYASHGVVWFVMGSRPKCDQCTRRGRPCVGVSWESLDRTRLSIRKQIRNANNELVAKHAELAALSSEVVGLQMTWIRRIVVLRKRPTALLLSLGVIMMGQRMRILKQCRILSTQCLHFPWVSILAPPQNLEASMRFSLGYHGFSEVSYPFHFTS